jgi:hypothetical protein
MGPEGAGSFALGVERRSLDAWRKRLQESGVGIEKAVAWPKGGRSISFRDPAGDSVELVTPEVWGLPRGW